MLTISKTLGWCLNAVEHAAEIAEIIEEKDRSLSPGDLAKLQKIYAVTGRIQRNISMYESLDAPDLVVPFDEGSCYDDTASSLQTALRGFHAVYAIVPTFLIEDTIRAVESIRLPERFEEMLAEVWGK